MKYTKYLAILAAAFMMGSCSDDFLDKEPSENASAVKTATGTFVGQLLRSEIRISHQAFVDRSGSLSALPNGPDNK